MRNRVSIFFDSTGSTVPSSSSHLILFCVLFCVLFRFVLRGSFLRFSTSCALLSTWIEGDGEPYTCGMVDWPFLFCCRAPLGARRRTLLHMCLVWASWQLDLSPLEGHLRSMGRTLHTHPPTHPFSLSLTHPPTHPPTHTRVHTHARTHARTPTHTRPPTHPHPPTHPPTHSLSHPPTVPTTGRYKFVFIRYKPSELTHRVTAERHIERRRAKPTPFLRSEEN